jgi:hypothetical protein
MKRETPNQPSEPTRLLGPRFSMGHVRSSRLRQGYGGQARRFNSKKAACAQPRALTFNVRQ